MRCHRRPLPINGYTRRASRPGTASRPRSVEAELVEETSVGRPKLVSRGAASTVTLKGGEGRALRGGGGRAPVGDPVSQAANPVPIHAGR
jgi:hypothetical protein